MSGYRATWVEVGPYGSIKLHKTGTTADQDFTLSAGDCVILTRSRRTQSLTIKQFTGPVVAPDGIVFTINISPVDLDAQNLTITKINCSNLNPPAAAGGSRSRRNTRNRSRNRSRRSRQSR